MKNLFYIAFIVILLALASIYIKQAPNANIDASSSPTVNSMDTNETSEDCVCDSECLCAEDDVDCDCSQTKSTCLCKQQDGQVITVESVDDNNEDIVEDNPDETADEDETILEE